MKISESAIYFTDNGAAYCGKHLGYTAKTTGRDLSGQPIQMVRPEDAAEAARDGWTIKCEQCGKQASRFIHVSA